MLDQSQVLVERLSWSFPTKDLARSTVQVLCDGSKVVSTVLAQVSALWEVLTQQAVCVFVRPPLPRTAWITEVDWEVSVDAELGMLSHFRTLVPGERSS